MVEQQGNIRHFAANDKFTKCRQNSHWAHTTNREQFLECDENWKRSGTYDFHGY